MSRTDMYFLFFEQLLGIHPIALKNANYMGY